MNDVKTNLKSLGDKADDIRKRAADTLESAAESVRTAGNQGADTIHEFAGEAGKKLDSTAKYVRKACVKRAFGAEKTFGGFLSSIRRNPLRSLALATAVGVVAGFSCRRQTGT